MRGSPRTLLGLAILATVCLGRSASAQELRDEIGDFLASQVEAEGIPGVSAAVVWNGTVLYQGAFGVRRLGGDEALTPDHIFHWILPPESFDLLWRLGKGPSLGRPGHRNHGPNQL